MVSTLSTYALLERLPECMIVIDPVADRFEYANKSACKLLGRDLECLFRDRVSSYFRGSLPQLISFTEEVLDSGMALLDELVLFSGREEEIALEVTASCMNSGGPVIFCLRDKNKFQQWRLDAGAQRHHRYGLLQWQRIHQVFQTIERENQLILSAAGEGIYGIDADGCATFVNPAAERLLEWNAEELIGKNIHAAIHYSHPDGSDYCVHDCPIYAAFKDGAVRRVEDEVFWSKSGKPIAVDYTSTPILDNGHLVGAVVIFRDISDRKNAELKLRTALNEVDQLRQKLELENAYLQQEISEGYNSHYIVGNSPAVKQVINQVQLVAPTDATVLIAGESGTGKELIARALHNASERKNRPLVKVNCAAVPRDLFESEFFGHIRGAFSGAVSDRVGRFELADGGSLFLDEVGEIPLELQGKLLRALQDSEFERVGESASRTVDVRVIAATNRDLKLLVQQGKFREDLYFRLNVFPIRSVPLRERRDDIPLLISHFLKNTCKRFNKPELKISLGQVKELQGYDWPGNIRELENLIERQVILSRGEKLVLESQSMQMFAQSKIDNIEHEEIVTEHDYKNTQIRIIRNALRRSRGKIYGEDGAAALLGVKPTTLASRIKKYGIRREGTGV